MVDAHVGQRTGGSHGGHDMERQRRGRDEIDDMRKKMRAFWSEIFHKDNEWVSSGMFRRVVKL